MAPRAPPVAPPLTVPDVAAWARFLVEHGTTSTGVWLTLARRGRTQPTSLTKQEALEEALCHGWIDGQGGRSTTHADSAYLQRFTPRKATSIWSKRNVDIVAQLGASGRMQPAGLAAVEAARADGRWDRAYEVASKMQPPEDLMTAIEANPQAAATWAALLKGPRYMMCMQLVTLRTAAGREKKIRGFVEALANGDAPASAKISSKKGTAAKRGVKRSASSDGDASSEAGASRIKTQATSGETRTRSGRISRTKTPG